MFVRRPSNCFSHPQRLLECGAVISRQAAACRSVLSRSASQTSDLHFQLLYDSGKKNKTTQKHSSVLCFLRPPLSPRRSPTQRRRQRAAVAVSPGLHWSPAAAQVELRDHASAALPRASLASRRHPGCHCRPIWHRCGGVREPDETTGASVQTFDRF